MNEEIKNSSLGKWYLSQELKEVSHAEISQKCDTGRRDSMYEGPEATVCLLRSTKAQEASMPGTQCVEGQQGRGRFLGLVVAVKAW